MDLQRVGVIVLVFLSLLTPAVAESAKSETPWESWVKENLVLPVEEVNNGRWSGFVGHLKGMSLSDMHNKGADLQWLPAYIGCTHIDRSKWESADYIEVILAGEDGSEQGGGINKKICDRINDLMREVWGIPT